jgi:hypothetical protein
MNLEPAKSSDHHDVRPARIYLRTRVKATAEDSAYIASAWDTTILYWPIARRAAEDTASDAADPNCRTATCAHYPLDCLLWPPIDCRFVCEKCVAWRHARPCGAYCSPC